MSIRPIYRKLRERCRLYRKINWCKSLYFNFKYFSFATARKMPVLFYGKVCFGKLKGSIKVARGRLHGHDRVWTALRTCNSLHGALLK